MPNRSQIEVNRLARPDAESVRELSPRQRPASSARVAGRPWLAIPIDGKTLPADPDANVVASGTLIYIDVVRLDGGTATPAIPGPTRAADGTYIKALVDPLFPFNTGVLASPWQLAAYNAASYTVPAGLITVWGDAWGLAESPPRFYSDTSPHPLNAAITTVASGGNWWQGQATITYTSGNTVASVLFLYDVWQLAAQRGNYSALFPVPLAGEAIRLIADGASWREYRSPRIPGFSGTLTNAVLTDASIWAGRLGT